MENFENIIAIESNENLANIKDECSGEQIENIEVEVLNHETILQDHGIDSLSCTQSAEHFVADSLEEMKTKLQNYTEKTSFRFITQCQDKHFKLPCKYFIFYVLLFT